MVTTINSPFDENGYCEWCGKRHPDSEQYYCCSACLKAKKTLLGHFKCSYWGDFCECEDKIIKENTKPPVVLELEKCDIE